MEASGLSVDNMKVWAQELGLDSAVFDKCLDSDATATEVRRDLAEGEAIGVRATPTFYVNGVVHEGSPSVEAFERWVGLEPGK